MTYGTIKVDTVTFTNAGVDKSVTLSGLVQNPVFSGNVTVTGTLSGVTVTGTTANFTSGNFTNISGGTHTITSGVFAAGSAASPSITFTGDLNTGIYSPGADQVAISTGGSGRLFVDASGRVGVGTTPSYALDVTGLINTRNANPSAFDAIQFYGTGMGTNNKFWRTQITTTDQNWQTVDDAYTTANTWLKATRNGNQVETISFHTGTSGTSERLRITSAGLVGVGTSSPSAQLDLVGTAPGEGLIRTSNGTTTSFFGATATSFAFWNSGLNPFPALAIGTTTNHPIVFGTNNIGRVVVDTSGNVGVGTTSPGGMLHVAGATILGDNGTNGRFTIETNTSRVALLATTTGFGAYQNLEIYGAATIFHRANLGEAARIDSSGRLLVGTSSARGPGDHIGRLQVEGTGYATSTISIFANSNDAFGSYLFLGKSRGTAVGSNTIVQSGDSIGQIRFSGTDGTGAISGAIIESFVDGTPGANDMPGRLVFSTTADGASSPTERLRIDSSGRVGIGTSSPTNYGAGVTTISVNGSGGSIADFYFNGARQGLIGTIGSNQMVIDTASTSIPLTLKTNNNTALTIDTSQRVGIGTTSPGYPLEVSTNGNSIQFPLSLTNTGTSGNTLGVAQLFRVYTGSAITTCGGITATGSTWGYGTYQPNSINLLGASSGGIGIRTVNAPIIFSNGNADVDQSTERLRIDSSGRVGIGTSSPSVKLEVSGPTASNPEIRVVDGTVNTQWYASNAGECIFGTFSNHPQVFRTNGSERLRITAGGSVGIGTAGPGHLLTVVATAGAQDIFLAGQNGVSNGYRITSNGTALTHAWFNSASEAARIDTSGRLLVGTSSSTMSGGVVQQNGNLGIIANNGLNIATNGTLDITINSGGGCFTGFMIVENTLATNAAARTQTLYAVMGRGTSATFTSLATANGTTSGASFSLSCPSLGVIRVTNTHGGPTNINLCWYGPTGY